MSLITKLIDEHNATVQYTEESQYKDGFLDGMKAAIDIVKKHNGWISVDDNPPSDKEWVYGTDGSTVVIIAISHHNGTSKWVEKESLAETHLNITHWQPLPKAPKE